MEICTDLTGMIETNIIFLSAVVSILTTALIAVSYMIGNMISNPKVTLWAKTEIVQLAISIASVLIIIIMINSFCSISPNAASALTDLPSASISGSDIFDGANEYLKQASEYTHDVLTIQRYHLMAYDFLSFRSMWGCGGFLDCWGSSIGISGKSYAWAPYFASGFNLAFNSVLLAFLSTLNFLFILQYINSGFVLFFLPMGIFFRAFPFLRKLGSLFISIAFAFMIVYPLILSSFVLISDDLFNYIDDSILAYTDESRLTGFGFGDAMDSSFDASGSCFDLTENELSECDTYITDFIFPDGRKEEIALQLVGRAFLVGVFLPTLALIATIASVGAIARELGQEINLSRIVQMV